MLIIFDLDGTLVDSMDLHAEIFGSILRETHGIPTGLSMAEYYKTAGFPLDQQFRHILMMVAEPSTIQVDRLVYRFCQLVEASEPILFPEVRGVLNNLTRKGYSLAVISGATADLVGWKLDKTEIHSYFKVALGTDVENPNMAKGEGHFRIIRSRLGLSQEDFRKKSLLVGDAEHDMLIAKQAGLVAVGRGAGARRELLSRAGADFLVDDLGGLLDILEVIRPPTWR